MGNTPASLFDNPIGLPLNIHGCQNNANPRPIWEESTWDKLRQTYRDVVGKRSTITVSTSETAIAVPFEVLHHKDKGRAVFVTSEVKRGDLVWDDGETASFPREKQFLKFVSLLPFELACDILQWTYVYDENNGQKSKKNLKVAVDLGEGVFFNHDKDPAVRTCNSSLQSINGCELESFQLFAYRDLHPGDEITVDYTAFDHSGEQDFFEELATCAWIDCDVEGESEELAYWSWWDSDTEDKEGEL
jgi:hypothetical protein